MALFSENHNFLYLSRILRQNYFFLSLLLFFVEESLNILIFFGSCWKLVQMTSKEILSRLLKLLRKTQIEFILNSPQFLFSFFYLFFSVLQQSFFICHRPLLASNIFQLLIRSSVKKGMSPEIFLTCKGKGFEPLKAFNLWQNSKVRKFYIKIFILLRVGMKKTFTGTMLVF
jgi:hypothetical protein